MMLKHYIYYKMHNFYADSNTIEDYFKIRCNKNNQNSDNIYSQKYFLLDPSIF